MKKLICYLITAMMVLTMMPYTAFAGTDSSDINIALGAPEEIEVDLFENSKVTVECNNTNIVRGNVLGTALILSDGAAIYRTTVRVMPVKTGSAKITVKADGKVKSTYNINVVPAEKVLESHIDEKPIIEYVSFFDGELTNTNTDNVKATVLSKTKRITTESIDGKTLTDTQYIYKIQIEYKALGEYNYSLIGSMSGEFYRISGKVTKHNWSDEYVVDKAPTCTKRGIKSIHCEQCELTKDPVAISATGHKFGDWITETEPTCTAQGAKYKECENCNATERDTLAQLQHEFEWIIDVPASVESAGEKHEACTICGIVRNENTSISKFDHEHIIVSEAPIAAGCETTGTIQYYSCSECDGIYADVMAQLPLTEKEIITEPVGHEYGSWIIEVAPTCDKPGVRYKLCKRCDDKITEEIAVLEHDLQAIPAVEATCVKNGRTEGSQCSACKRIFIVPEIITATGHTFEKELSHDVRTHWYACHCGAKQDEVKHDYKWIIDTAATEKNAGSKHEECSICGAVRNEKTVIDQLNHTHTMFYVKAKEPTCAEDGNIAYYYCVGCNISYFDKGGKNVASEKRIVIPAPGHAYGGWRTMNDSTCYRIGYEFNSCAKCGLAQIRVIPRKAHNLEETTIAATCTTDGANIVSCKDCKYKAEYVIPAFGHKSKWVPAVAPTCTKDGMTSAIKCAVCDVYISAPKAVPATGHNCGTWITDVEPTCSTEGSKHRVCKVCSDVENAPVEKLPHTPAVIPAVEATCNSIGLTQGICCGVCSVVITPQQIIPMHDHSWETEYETDVTSTINRDGSMSYHCAECNMIQADSSIKIPQIKKTTVTSLVYNGVFQTPVVTVVDYADNTLEIIDDFIVTYKDSTGEDISSPKSVGEYKAVVTFQGLYSGYVVKKFTIAPKSTYIAKVTKPAKKQIKVTWQKRTAQVTGYEIQYSTTKTFTKATTKTLKVKNYKTNNKTIKNLKSKKNYWVKVRTYKTVGSKIYYSTWSKAWVVKTK